MSEDVVVQPQRQRWRRWRARRSTCACCCGCCRRFSRCSATSRPRSAPKSDYLKPGYTFQLTVSGTNLSCVCRRTEKGSFKRVPPERVARDVEPGSGLTSAQADTVTIDYVIAFCSLAYAFDCFSGGMTLKQALAQRAFSTRGPNDTGVSLTYMFTALLKTFFGWRAAYRTPKTAAPAAR